MPIDLESFYTIDEWSFTGSDLVVRLLPDFFSMEIVEPVVTATVVDARNTQEARSGLAAYKTEMIVDIKANARTVELWGEYDHVPLSIEGREVRLSRSAYSSQDLARVIEQLDSQLSSSQAENARLRGHMKEVEQFAVDLITRAQARKAMSLRNTSPSDAQIDALSRVLRRIQDA